MSRQVPPAKAKQQIEMPKAMTVFVDPSLITLMGGGCWVAGICSEDSGHDGKRTTSCEG